MGASLVITRKNDLNQSIYHLQQTLSENNVIIGNLKKENDFLKTKMALNEEIAKKQSDFRTVFEKMQQELMEFKENIKEVTENINESQTEKEIARLKRENAGLYSQLKMINPSYCVGGEKISELKVLEGEVKKEKDKLGKKLDDLKGVMNEAMNKFVDAMEKAHWDIEKVLGTSKKRLGVIEELQGDIEHSKETEQIKYILLHQNNMFIKDLMGVPPSRLNYIPTVPTIQIKNNFDVSIEKEIHKKDVNIEKNSEEKENQSDDSLKILIFYAEETEEDDEDKTRKILKKLTKKNLNNIKANRMGKKGNRARPIIVTLDKLETLNDIMKSRYSLKETEFKGVKIVKFKKDHKKTTTNVVNKKNKAADSTNPLLSDESDCENEEEVKEDDEEDKELPFKIVLHYIPESDNDYDRVVEILRVLTDLPLRSVGFRRLGLKPKNHVRPIVVSFQKEEYVNDCIKNKFLLKDNGFPKVRVCHYKDNLESNN